jgi:hypothetical protein
MLPLLVLYWSSCGCDLMLASIVFVSDDSVEFGTFLSFLQF